MNTETTGAQGQTQSGIQYGGFWRRAAAYLLDSVFAMIIVFPVQLAATFGVTYFIINAAESGGDPDAMTAAATVIFVIIALAVFLFIALYFIIFPCTKWQATPGKRIVGLKITDAAGNKISFGRSLGRFLSTFVSGLILYIGFIMIGFTDRKRGLHDMMAGTLVVKR